MTEKIEIRLPKAKNTASCGRSLAASLYTVPLTLFLHGELGAGKTTFLQGFAQGLGIKERLTSPTYALEQRYKVNIFHPLSLALPPSGRETIDLLHIDLYRIDQKEANEMVDSRSDFEGIRCIEWSEKILEHQKYGPHIDIVLTEKSMHARELALSFHDISLPSRKNVETWRKQLMVLEPICKHCDIVGKLAERIAHVLLKRGIIIRPKALRRAGELHDLLRFLDFKNPPPNPPSVWQQWKARYPLRTHESACALFLRENGFDALAAIVEPHGLPTRLSALRTIEQKVLYYSDKRVIDRVVSIDERFDYFARRYSKGEISKKHTQWYEEVKVVEKELFPDGAPF